MAIAPCRAPVILHTLLKALQEKVISYGPFLSQKFLGVHIKVKKGNLSLASQFTVVTSQ